MIRRISSIDWYGGESPRERRKKMTFNYAKGTPKYMVSVYGWNVEDRYYYDYFRDAVKKFDNLTHGIQGMSVCVSVYDMANDIRKRFAKIEEA